MKQVALQFGSGQLEVKEQGLVERVADELQLDLAQSYNSYQDGDGGDIDWDQIKEELEKSKALEKETRLPYRSEDTLLLVVIKDPGRIPRIMPIGIEDPRLFITEDFKETWANIGDKVRAEISRQF